MKYTIALIAALTASTASADGARIGVGDIADAVSTTIAQRNGRR